ncbi:MAG: hypothetical protein V7629_07920 [Motiliproteus sp.]
MFLRPWIALIAGSLLSPYCTAQPLVFAANDWCPFICDLDSDKPGILVEILNAVYPERDRVSIRRLPLARGIVETRANRTQGILGVVPDTAPDLVFPPLAAVTTQLCFFTLPDSNWRYDSSTQQHPDMLVGMVKSKKVNDRFVQGFPNRVTVHGEKDTAIRLIQLLQRGRIDTLIEEKTSIDYILQLNPRLPRLRRAGCGEERPEYIAFSPAAENPQALALQFAERLEALRRSGRIDAILNTYGAGPETRGGVR